MTTRNRALRLLGEFPAVIHHLLSENELLEKGAELSKLNLEAYRELDVKREKQEQTIKELLIKIEELEKQIALLLLPKGF